MKGIIMANFKFIAYEDSKHGTWKYQQVHEENDLVDLKQKFIKRHEFDTSIEVSIKDTELSNDKQSAWTYDRNSPKAIMVVRTRGESVFVFHTRAEYVRNLPGFLEYIRCNAPMKCRELEKIDEFMVFEDTMDSLEISAYSWSGENDACIAIEDGII